MSKTLFLNEDLGKKINETRLKRFSAARRGESLTRKTNMYDTNVTLSCTNYLQLAFQIPNLL